MLSAIQQFLRNKPRNCHNLVVLAGVAVVSWPGIFDEGFLMRDFGDA
jgi:hypothetical protein